MTKLDYTLQSPEERNELVKKIVEENPDISEAYLDSLADYLVLCLEKKEKKEKKLLTDNRLTTINKRECSFEGLVSQLENGEDGIYNMINDNKNMIFQPKIMISKKDVEEIPELEQVRQAIKILEAKMKVATGKDAFVIKKALIDLRKDQYLIKTSFRRPILPSKLIKSKSYIQLNDKSYIDSNDNVVIDGISLMDWKVCSAILCNYSKLKQDSYGEYEKDLWYVMKDFDDLCGRALEPYPLYEKIVLYKIDNLPNNKIQELLQQEMGLTHSVEYISSLWRNKIPKLIASVAEDEFIMSYYLNEKKGHYKKCSRCGQIKLANNKYFSKNKTSSDGYYSICKCCRNSKKKKDK